MKDKTRNNGKNDGSSLPQSAENASESREQGTGALSRKILIGLALGIVVVLGVPLFFPQWTSASFFSTTMVTTPPQPDFIKLYLPERPVKDTIFEMNRNSELSPAGYVVSV